jgi:hypothetical protein
MKTPNPGCFGKKAEVENPNGASAIDCRYMPNAIVPAAGTLIWCPIQTDLAAIC